MHARAVRRHARRADVPLPGRDPRARDRARAVAPRLDLRPRAEARLRVDVAGAGQHVDGDPERRAVEARRVLRAVRVVGRADEPRRRPTAPAGSSGTGKNGWSGARRAGARRRRDEQDAARAARRPAAQWCSQSTQPSECAITVGLAVSEPAPRRAPRARRRSVRALGVGQVGVGDASRPPPAAAPRARSASGPDPSPGSRGGSGRTAPRAATVPADGRAVARHHRAHVPDDVGADEARARADGAPATRSRCAAGRARRWRTCRARRARPATRVTRRRARRSGSSRA